MIRMLIEHYKARRLERVALRRLAWMLDRDQLTYEVLDMESIVRDARPKDVR